MDQNIVSELRSLLPTSQVLDDSASLLSYGRDWVKHYDPKPSAIVFPTSTEEVRDLVLFARRRKIALVPSGGRTGLSGAAVAEKGEVVVSFEKMNKILDFNPVDRTVTCQAGVVTESLQKHVRDQGFFYPVDFAARGSSHIGGNIATNAGGIKVIRYGLTREWVAGLKVVTGAGDILELNRGLVKNATGFDLRHLFIGSEGALGFVTEATLRFTVPPKPLTVLVLGVPSLDAIMNVFREFRDTLPLTAFEFFSDVALKHVVAHTSLAQPLAQSAPNYLLVEVENTESEIESRILSTFETCVEKGWVLDGVVSQSETQARDFWRLREDISEATSPYSPYKNDISVKVSDVPGFLTDVDAVLRTNYPDFEVVWFGHIGDGNMHINILKPHGLGKEEFIKKCLRANTLLFDVVGKYGGSISAEHGVGLVKKPYLEYSRSAEEIALMKGIKRVFDPDQILNPGKIFD
ncbi:MAG: FAD-binding oxidoreductase [Bdellovibrionaceae bacterium]|nr:FAD-binding oxidoreductase [Pseudobdellovibrionaceae bacterium]